MCNKCAVCKQNIPDGLSIPINENNEYVHYGECHNFYKEQKENKGINESVDTSPVELLM